MLVLHALLYATLTLQWTEARRGNEFVFIHNYTTQKEPVSSFIDVNGKKVYCYQAGADSSNILNQIKQEYNFQNQYKQSTEQINQEEDKVLRQTLSNLNVKFDLEDGSQFHISQNEITYTPSYKASPTFNIYQIPYYIDGVLQSNEVSRHLIAMNKLFNQGFNKTKQQLFTINPPRQLKLEQLKNSHKKLGIPDRISAIPRTMYWRESTILDQQKQGSGQQQEKAQRLSQQQLIANLNEQIDLDGYIHIGEVDIPLCIHDKINTAVSMYATCLPKAMTDQCVPISAEQTGVCSITLKIGCSQLCRIKALAEETVRQIDYDAIICSYK